MWTNQLGIDGEQQHQRDSQLAVLKSKPLSYYKPGWLGNSSRFLLPVKSFDVSFRQISKAIGTKESQEELHSGTCRLVADEFCSNIRDRPRWDHSFCIEKD